MKNAQVATGSSDRRTDTKVCLSCGRTMSWRKSWAKNWDDVKYCSKSCRARGVSDFDVELEAKILELLRVQPRSGGVSSDAAALGNGEGDPEFIESIRRAARRLVAAGDVEITQGGRVIDPSTAKGTFLIRRAP